MRSSTEWRRSIAVCWLGVFLLAIVSGTSSSQPGTDEGQSKATLLLYSGVENPSFDLDAAELERIAEHISKSEPLDDYAGETVIPSILGYNGVRIDNPNSKFGLPTVILIYRGDIELEGTSFKRDPEMSIEYFLLDLALQKEVLDEPAVKFMQSALSQPKERASELN